MSKMNALLARLERVRGKNGRWVASCPHHADKSPSLALSEKDDGRILIHCFAGCSVQEVLGAIGMEFGDLFPDVEGHHHPKVKPRFHPADLLKIISFEATIVSICANDMARGKKITQTDTERLRVAYQRITEALNHV